MTYNPTNPIMPNDEDKLWSGLAYVGLMCCMVPTLVIFALKRDESAYIQFHCLQAIGLGLIATVGILAFGILGRVPILGFWVGIFYLLGNLAFFGVWIYLVVQTFRGQETRIPILAEWIDRRFMG